MIWFFTRKCQLYLWLKVEVSILVLFCATFSIFQSFYLRSIEINSLSGRIILFCCDTIFEKWFQIILRNFEVLKTFFFRSFGEIFVRLLKILWSFFNLLEAFHGVAISSTSLIKISSSSFLSVLFKRAWTAYQYLLINFC